MLKLTLCGANAGHLWINPRHIVSMFVTDVTNISAVNDIGDDATPWRIKETPEEILAMPGWTNAINVDARVQNEY